MDDVPPEQLETSAFGRAQYQDKMAGSRASEYLIGQYGADEASAGSGGLIHLLYMCDEDRGIGYPMAMWDSEGVGSHVADTLMNEQPEYALLTSGTSGGVTFLGSAHRTEVQCSSSEGRVRCESTVDQWRRLLHPGIQSWLHDTTNHSAH